MDQQKKFEFVEEKNHILMEIKLEINDLKPNEIDRIIFVIDDGQITWKPKITKEEYFEGLKKVSSKKMSIENIPNKLKEIGNFLKLNSKMRVLACYNIMTVTEDNETKSYKFLKSIKEFDKWAFNFEKIKDDPSEVDIDIID